MKIIIVGLPYFGERLAQGLKKFDPSLSVHYLNTYYKKTDKLKALYRIPSADIVFSINGSLDRSNTFDLALRNRVPLVMMWVGSDVQQATETVKKGVSHEKYRKEAVHFCEVDWIRSELAEIGIDATVQNFAAFQHSGELAPFASDRLQVCCYINDRVPDFYGMQELLRLTNRFPEITFHVVGSHVPDYHPLPSNIITHGWIDSIAPVLNQCQVTLRFPGHDGLATFVLESLLQGKHVLYKYPFPHCIHTPSYDSMVLALQRLQETFKTEGLQPNPEGSAYVREAFGQEKIYGGLIKKFRQIVLEAHSMVRMSSLS